MIDSEKRHINNSLEQSSKKKMQATSSSTAAMLQEKVTLTSALQEERHRLSSTLTKLAERDKELARLASQVRFHVRAPEKQLSLRPAFSRGRNLCCPGLVVQSARTPVDGQAHLLCHRVLTGQSVFQYQAEVDGQALLRKELDTVRSELAAAQRLATAAEQAQVAAVARQERERIDLLAERAQILEAQSSSLRAQPATVPLVISTSTQTNTENPAAEHSPGGPGLGASSHHLHNVTFLSAPLSVENLQPHFSCADFPSAAAALPAQQAGPRVSSSGHAGDDDNCSTREGILDGTRAAKGASMSATSEHTATLTRRVAGLRKKLADKSEIIASLEQQVQANATKYAQTGCFCSLVSRVRNATRLLDKAPTTASSRIAFDINAKSLQAVAPREKDWRAAIATSAKGGTTETSKGDPFAQSWRG